jgi:regulator of sirC expression with transglutaminase-like and TPR domain
MRDFRRSLTLKPLDVPTSALLCAQSVAYPELEVARYLARLDELAVQAAEMMHGSPADRAVQLCAFLYDGVGLRGNALEYDDPRNSFINDVLDRGLGLPISLSVIYVAVARRLGLKAAGVGLPGHFIAVVEDRVGEVYIDLFHGRRVSGRDCAQLMRETTGYAGIFRPEWLNPTSPRLVLSRMLNNLRLIYIRGEQWTQAVRTVKLLQVVQPDSAEYLRDLGMPSFNQGDQHHAARYLDAYLQTLPADDKEAHQLQRTVGTQLAIWSRQN